MSALPNNSMSGVLPHTVGGVLTRAAMALALAVALACASTPEPTASEDEPSDEIGLANTGEESPAEGQDPWAQSAPAESDTREQDAAAAAAASPATKLTGVSAREADGGVIVELSADGRIDGAEMFTVPDPLRLVIDLPGLKSDGVAAKSDVAGAMISRIRVAQHDAKVRVVVDAAAGVTEFPAQTSQPLAGGMSVALGGALPAAELASDVQVAEESASSEDSPVEEAPESAPAAMPEEAAVASSGTHVLGVQFAGGAPAGRQHLIAQFLGAAAIALLDPIRRILHAWWAGQFEDTNLPGAAVQPHRHILRVPPARFVLVGDDDDRAAIADVARKRCRGQRAP